MSDQSYFEDSTLWGEYQFTTLEDVVNNYIAGRDPDDYTAVTPRYQILLQAKKGVRELYFDIVRSVKAMEMEVSPTLNITIPPDFVSLVRLSWIGEDGRLVPIAFDKSIPIAESYLQDHEYSILFDESGEVLKSSVDQKVSSSKNYQFCGTFNPNVNLSKKFSSGAFSFNSATGIIQFTSDVEGKSVVLEYISDGLYDGNEIKLHKFAEASLYDYIYYELIKNRRNVPANEKFRARKEYYNSRKWAKKRINSIRKEDLIQAMKGSTKWIKN